MKLVAIETSTEYCSVALWHDGQLTERCERVGQRHSEVLLGMLDELLAGSGFKLRQLDGIAFGKGPGSFTGVRIACGVAQGLALGAGLNVVGVCTLEALAQASGRDRVLTAIDARMGELYLAAYERRDGAWAPVIEPCLCMAAEAPALPGEEWFGSGSGFAAVGDALQARYGAGLAGVDAQAVPQAGAVAQLAAVDFERGKAVDAALALPLYLRDKVALKTSERTR